MIVTKGSYRWHAFSVFVSATTILLNIKLDWPLMRLSQMRLLPNFIDHYAVFDFIPCISDDLLICKQYYYGHAYLEIIAPMNRFTMTETILLILFVALFLIVVSCLIQVNSFYRLILMQAFILSPPVMFLLERGNLELLIFSLIAISVIRPLSRHNLIQSFTLFFASLIKFYPVALLILIFLRTKSTLSRIYVLLLIASFAFIVSRLDFPLKMGATETYCCSFGNNIWGLYLIRLGLNINHLCISLIGLIFFSLVYVVSLLVFNRSYVAKSLAKEMTFFQTDKHLPLQSFLIIFSLLYFSGTNFDYKLMYLSIIPILLLSNRELSQKGKVFHFLAFCAISVFTFPSGYLQPLGDFFLLCYFVFLLYVLFPLRKGKIHINNQ